MSSIRISFILLIGLVGCALVLGHGHRRGGGGGSSGGMSSAASGMSSYASSSSGTGGRRGGKRHHRATLYNDDEVYGYEASYPGGEAMYINYRNSEARAKRGQEFRRSNPFSRSDSFGGGPGQMEYQGQNGRNERGADYDPMW